MLPRLIQTQRKPKAFAPATSQRLDGWNDTSWLMVRKDLWDSGKIKTFVDAMNGVLSFIQTQNRMTKETDTSKTLGGDSILRSVESRMRQMVQNPQFGIKGNIRSLSQLGISFNRTGTLDFDQKKFNSVLAANPDHVQEFFAGDGSSTGFIAAVRREGTNLTNPAFGPLNNRARGLNSDRSDGSANRTKRTTACEEGRTASQQVRET